MANFFLKSATKLRQPLACLTAFAAGCLISGVAAADENDNKPSKTDSRMDRLFAEDAIEFKASPRPTTTEDGLSKIADSLGPLRSLEPRRQIEAGPSAHDILGGIKQAGQQQFRQPKAQLVMPKQPVWTPPPTPRAASAIPVAPVETAPRQTRNAVDNGSQKKLTLSQYAASLASWQEPQQDEQSYNRLPPAQNTQAQQPVAYPTTSAPVLAPQPQQARYYPPARKTTRQPNGFQAPAVQPDVTRVPSIEQAQKLAQQQMAAQQQKAAMESAATATRMPVQNSMKPTSLDSLGRKYKSPSTYSGVHRLANVDIQKFESAVLGAWGSRLRTSSSPDGRFVRVEVPTRVRERMAMMIDRQTATLNYEGDERLRDNWHRLMSHMDTLPQRRVDGSLLETKVVDAHRAEMATIQQATFLMGINQVQEGSQDSTTLPGGTFIPGTVAQGNEIPQGTQGIKNTVKIREDPETGAITLIGDPADLAIVQKIITQISKEAADRQPIVDRIPLMNLQSEAVAEQVQTIYDSTYAQAKGTAAIEPLQSPNALLVVGQPGSIEAVRNIISSMDVASDDAVGDGFKTIRLKYISAQDAKARLDTFFGQANLTQGDNVLPSAPILVIPDFRTNSVTIKGSAQFIAQGEAFLARIDTVDNDNSNRVKIVKLRNTVATDLAIVIQDAINGQQANAGLTGVQSQNGPQVQPFQPPTNVALDQSTLPSTALTIATIDEQGRRKEVRSGVLFDVRVTPDANSNSLIIRGPEESIELVLELIKQLDQIPDAETQIKVFEIVNGDASGLLDMLESLFGSDAQQGGGQAQGTDLTQLPLQNTSATDGQTLVNLRFTLDARTNTIIASGPAGDLVVVEDLLNRLDGQLTSRRTPQVYRLSNAPVSDVAEAINQYLEPRNELVVGDPRTPGAINQTNQNVIVVAEVNSNSLIVDATPEYRAEIEEIIRALDRRPPMVKVKVLIAEVDLNTLEEFGVELGVQDSLLFDRGTSIGAGGGLTGIGFPFNDPTQIPNLNGTFQETLAGQALSTLGTGRINSDLGYGGLVLSAGNESISVLMRALKDRQCVRVLSKPHIMTLENLQGRVSIGAEVPRVSGTNTTNFGVVQEVEFVDVGVILEVTPRVSPDGMIVMQVNAKKSSVGPDETAITIGVGQDGTPIRAPQIVETEANTTLMARSGQTVVFSGLIQEEKAHTERGAPILSDLPIIGPLFKFESDASRRSELLIILTPYLVDSDSDIDLQNQDEMDRMHWCRCDVAEVYGNTDYDGYQGDESAVQTFYPDADPMGSRPQIMNGSQMIDAPQPGFEGAQSKTRQPNNQGVMRQPVSQATFESDRRR
ncbi:MAG: secretin N-terminal domain-containing protein [Mariniblastus sp.]